MSRPIQDVKVFGIQDRRANAQAKRPWIVRRMVDGQQRSTSFRTRGEADRYRSVLVHAAASGEKFEPGTGEPVSWGPAPRDVRLHDWCRQWLGGQWAEWQPRTRRTYVETIARFVVIAADSGTHRPQGLRSYLRDALQPDAAREPAFESWLDDYSPHLGDLDRERLAQIERELLKRQDGKPVAATTANRTRIVCRACILAAVDGGLIEVDPWPPRSRGRARRKVARRKSIDVRSLPAPATMVRAIDAIRSQQPASEKYRVMTAVAYYAGLRPSEVVMLRVRALTLPRSGWGEIAVTEADIDYDAPGEPKTGWRRVPIPPVLVRELRRWLDLSELTDPDALIFRTRTGRCPTPSNWGRAWKRGLAKVGHAPIRVYDCRHAAATTWLHAGVPLAEVARRLGHSVETLVSTYVGALEHDERTGNQRIERILGVAEPTSKGATPKPSIVGGRGSLPSDDRGPVDQGRQASTR